MSGESLPDWRSRIDHDEGPARLRAAGIPVADVLLELACRDPRPDLPRWVVTHVLSVSALELCHPVSFVIGMEAGDAPRDGVRRWVEAAHVLPVRRIRPERAVPGAP